ncbi:MAG: class I SAM-dependent methyltransferase, partial [Vicinamibacteria bacterium]|nr:class I SAM-dependent methyltransferase [Vicinamibacteria bacterium]
MMSGAPDPLPASPGTSGSPCNEDRFEADWRHRFEEFAEEREDDAGIAGWSRAGLDARVRQFLQAWSAPREGSLWLDAGCGAGTYTRLLRGRGVASVGTDYSFPTLRKAVQRESRQAAYAAADVRHLPFPDSTFDGALCFGVMQALSRSDEAVRALAGVVRPGGEVWVDALNRW